MKRDEPFNPSIKSAAPSKDLKFKLASAEDREAVDRLMAERNPTQDPADISKKTDREIALNSSDPGYRLFVADLNDQNFVELVYSPS